MRTLLRPGLKGVLVKVDGRGGPRFLVDGPSKGDCRMFFDLSEAERSFAIIEFGRSSDRVSEFKTRFADDIRWTGRTLIRRPAMKASERRRRIETARAGR